LPQYGPPAANQFRWDNLDVRYADKANFKDTSVVYGVSANNSPTVQERWNTTPAFGFPFVASNLSVVVLNGPQTSDAIPYFRVAYAPKWGNHSWQVGAFGLSANVTPAMVVIGTGFNQFRDLGLDSEYQYFGEGYVVALAGDLHL
jgi:hypothetical protein